jgi:hypothetical protein
MCANCWLCYIQKFELLEYGLHKQTMFYIRDRTATFLMQQVMQP